MHRFSLSGAEAVLISILLIVCFHLLPWNQYRQRHNFLENPKDYLAKEQVPSRANAQQKAYLTYVHGDKEQAVLSRTEIASGSTEQEYNLGTLLAMMSVTSGEVTDLKRLQQAEQYLSGATAHDETRSAELDHNLAMVRKLLQEQQQQNQEQDQQQTGSGEQQQENQEQQNTSGTDQQEEQNQQDSKNQEQQLSEAMKQQLEQYQQQLLGEQAQNQQFFDKRQPESEQSDPFNRLQELFGGDPQLKQELGGSGAKDW